MRVPIEQRFWTKVNKTVTCWLWTASTFRSGYGQIGAGGRPLYAHRLSWELAYGQIPNGLEVLHKCDVPACVRPDHLFLGTQQENLLDARRKGRLVDGLHNRKLTAEAIAHIQSFPALYGHREELARRYGVHPMTITRAFHGRVKPKRLVLERVPFVQLEIRGEVA